MGELALIKEDDSLTGLILDSLRGEEFLMGVYIKEALVLWAADLPLTGEPYVELAFNGDEYMEA